MRSRKFFRGIGFRVAALTTLLVLISMMALGAVVLVFVKSSLDERVREQLLDEVQTLSALYDPSDSERLIAETKSRSGPDFNSPYSYRLTLVDGTYLAGDRWLSAGAIRWSTQNRGDVISAGWLGGRSLKLTEPIGQTMILTIGRDVGWIADVETELLRILGWSLLGGMALATLTAFLANRFMSQRIDVVTGTAAAIMDGDLSQRVPLTGADDDFERLSHRLNAMLERIQDLMKGLEQVTNDIAHDLRTPLGRLRQGLELARAETSTPEQRTHLIEKAIGEADGLLSTFSSLLRIGQIHAGTRRSAFETVDMSKIALSVAEAYDLSAAETGHRLTSSVSPGIRMLGDRDLLTQLFANLIENALTHTPAGSEIHIGLAQSGGGIEATVADDGPGVPEQDREYILKRLYRLERSRTTPGTGLGLSMVSAIARLHGATLAAEDNAPGLRIRMVFPAAALGAAQSGLRR